MNLIFKCIHHLCIAHLTHMLYKDAYTNKKLFGVL